MRLINHPNLGQMQFVPENMGEISALKQLPAFLDKHQPSNDFSKFSSNKFPVVRNILNRLPKEMLKNVDTKWITGTKKLQEIPDSFTFHTTPLKHQHIAVRYLVTNLGGGLLLDPGLGKTKTVCDFIHYMKFRRVLVVCPKPLLFVWEDEFATHRPEIKPSIFETTDWITHANTNTSCWVMNYKKVCMLLDKLMDIPFDAIFIDEGLVKNPDSDQTRAITLLSKRIAVKCIMSGTLINNSEIDLYAPVNILEPSLVGGSYYKFRDTYFNTMCPSRDPTKKHLRKVVGAKDPEMMRNILRAASLIMRKEDWLDLPPKTFKRCVVEMPRETSKYYYELMSNYVTQVGDITATVDNVLSLQCKLTQISSGFLYDSDVEGLEDLFIKAPTKKKGKRKDRKTHFFNDQPKVAELLRILNYEIPLERTIVWYCMDAERHLIEQAFKQQGITHLTIAGGDRNIRGKVKQFNSDKSVRVLLCQAKTLNYGVTVLGKGHSTEEEDDEADENSLSGISFAQLVCTQIFYSLTNSLEVYMQQQDRIHRIGQTLPCSYYLILTNSPVEMGLIDRLDDKIEIREFMLEDIINKALAEYSYSLTLY